MPLPVVAAAAPAIISGLSQGLNIGATQSINRKTQEWNEKMYGIQRQDALTDWATQNEYNSPQAQMARLKAAGLNPNLVYGNGSVVANSQSMPRSVESKSWNPQVPQYNLPEVISQYQDFRLREAQIDALLESNNIKKLQVVSQALKNDVGKFDFTQKKKMADFVVQAAEQDVRLKKNQADLMSAKVNEIATLLPMKTYKFDHLDKPGYAWQLGRFIADTKIAIENAKMMPEQKKLLLSRINNLDANSLGALIRKEFTAEELGMLKNGITKTDNVFFRLLGKTIGNIFGPDAPNR